MRRNRREQATDEAVQAMLEEQPESDQETWETEWEDRVFAWACEQVRPSVTDATWQAFWRTAIDDRPGKDVASALEMSVAAVYRARSRVLARLKELIQSVQEP